MSSLHVLWVPEDTSEADPRPCSAYPHKGLSPLLPLAMAGPGSCRFCGLGDTPKGAVALGSRAGHAAVS